MKKILVSSIILSNLLFSEQIRIIPIDKSYLAQENGGNKTAIEAYSDGVGLITESKQLIDNSPMNELVYKYGEKAKNEGLALKEYSLEVGDNKEKDLANKLGKIGELNNNIEGTVCDDGNIQTINDKYINGICIGSIDIKMFLKSRTHSGGGGTWSAGNWGEIGQYWSGAGLCTSSDGIINNPKIHEYTFSEAIKINKFRIFQDTNNYYSQIKSIGIESSNDNINWTRLLTKNNIEFYSGENILSFTNNKENKYYRVLVLDVEYKGNTSAGYCQATLYTEPLN